MEINFNEGKKELDNVSDTEQQDSQEEMISADGEIITDFEEDNTDYEKIKQNRDREELKGQIKKMIIIAGAILGVILFLILIASLFMKKTYTYDKVEIVMKEACQKYFVDYKDYLPKEENDTKNVPVDNLVAGKYMKELSSYLPKDTCTGRVTVEKTATGYDYRPYLNCGKNKYQTMELYKKITADDAIVTSNYGLYNLNGNYVFRGEEVNNYVKLGDNVWRIFKVTSDGNIGLVLNKSISYSSLSWDDRYNKVKDYNIGINNYATSRIKENLEKLYNNRLDIEGFKLLKSAHKENLAKFDLCVGKRAHKDNTNNNSTECVEKVNDQIIGLLTVSDYMQASLDSNCNSTLSESCQNYNYLNTDYTWWFVTADKASSFDAYSFVPEYGAQVKHTSSSSYLRPVIYLKNNVFYKSGTGEESKPYTIK